MNIGQTLIQIAILVLIYAGGWKVFVKAGQPGWAFLIPIYNLYVLTKICKRPIMHFVLCFFIIGIFMLAMDLAKAFGKSGIWGFFLLTFLGVIGYPILGFGKAEYTEPQRS